MKHLVLLAIVATLYIMGQGAISTDQSGAINWVLQGGALALLALYICVVVPRENERQRKHDAEQLEGVVKEMKSQRESHRESERESNKEINDLRLQCERRGE